MIANVLRGCSTHLELCSDFSKHFRRLLVVGSTGKLAIVNWAAGRGNIAAFRAPLPRVRRLRP